jgi:mRNA interferase MazF
VIRGGIYRVNLGDVKRGHEQRGKRFGLVISMTDMAWSVVTIIPTSTSAQPANFRPEIELNGEQTRLLVDQIRTVDTMYISGEPIRHLSYSEMEQVEDALSHYLGL